MVHKYLTDTASSLPPAHELLIYARMCVNDLCEESRGRLSDGFLTCNDIMPTAHGEYCVRGVVLVVGPAWAGNC